MADNAEGKPGADAQSGGIQSRLGQSDSKVTDAKAASAGKLPGKDTNQHVSAAARLQEASTGSATTAPDSKVTDALREEQQRGADASKATQDAAPTGADIPQYAAENIKGVSTAVSRPDQPRTREDLKATGAQLEPALIAKDGGSIPHAMVSSPTGMVPASATGDGAAALARYGARLKAEAESDELSEEKLLTMNKHEIRAVAHDRGYKIGEGSVKALSRRFLDAQAEARTTTEKRGQSQRVADAQKSAGEAKK